MGVEMMKKNYLFLTTVLFAMLFVSACNETEKPDSEKDKIEESSAEAPIQDNEDTNEAEQNEQQQTDEQQSNEEQQLNDNQKTTITYSVNGKKVTAETVVVTSGTQNYKMMVAKDFTLTNEEPGRDMLIYNQNDAHSMTIETFSKEDTNYEEIKKETEDTIAITAPEGKYEQGNINSYLQSNNIKNAANYIVKYEEDQEQVVTAVFEKDNIIARLTIFDNLQSEFTDAFLQMGFTIQ